MPDQAPDHQAREFAAAFRQFLDWIHSPATGEDNEVVALVRDYLGADGMQHSVVTRDLPPFEHVNLQTAIDAWSARAGRTVEVRGIALPPHFGGLSLQQLVAGESLPPLLLTAPALTDLPNGPGSTLGSVRQGGTGALEGAQLGVAVGTPGAAVEQHHAELAGERLRHRDGRAAGDGEASVPGKCHRGAAKDMGRLLIGIGLARSPAGPSGYRRHAVQRARPHGGIRRRKAVTHQRAGLAVRADQRRRPAGLVEQVTDLAEIVHALLAQQRVHVRGRQPARPSSRSCILPSATRTLGGWSMRRAIRLCRRANATRRCATRRVTSATAPVANDADGRSRSGR